MYYNLNPKDRELTSEIYAGITYYTLIENDGSLRQALIPIGDGMQIHIFKRNGEFVLDFTPMIYFERTHSIKISIQQSPYQDLLELAKDKALVGEFLNAYKNSVNFRAMKKNDRLAVIYTRKYRLGKPLKNTQILAAATEINSKANFIFGYTNGRYYNQNGKEIQSFLLQVPVFGARISSKFSLGRRHPILRTVRPHYGVDYAAPRGTSIVAAADGIITFAGVKGGYGNVIEIRHEGGLKTLYAHMNSFAKGIKSGKRVKRGQIIGKVGSSGLSTGPHLHFGLYRNNAPINPLSSVKTISKELSGKQKQDFLDYTKPFLDELNELLDKEGNILLTKQDDGNVATTLLERESSQDSIESSEANAESSENKE